MASLFSLCRNKAITLLGKPKSDKPRVRAEPDAPKAPYAFRPLRLRIDSLHSITMEYASCTMRSQIASARIGSPIFSRQPGISNWEQKIVDAVRYRASAISRRSRASDCFSEYRSHSSSISSAGFLYC